MDKFAGKSAIITGGASGIGRAIGAELARRGANVVLADKNSELAEREARELARRGGGRVRAAALDVTDAEACAALVGEVVAEHGSLDYIFNNAGIAILGECRDHELADWYKTLDVNLRGVIHGIHAAYPVMCEQGSGHIVNTASLAGLVPLANEIAYAAAKHAVVGISTTLRAEAAGYGVKVSVVCPGFIDTPILYENMGVTKTAGIAFNSREETKRAVRFKVMAVDKAARIIVAGVERNKGLITVTRHAQVIWALYRLYPPAVVSIMRWFIGDIRRRFPRKPDA